MSDKKKLQEIKSKFEKEILGSKNNEIVQMYQDISWLMEQAEKVEHLEKEVVQLRALGELYLNKEKA